MIEYLKCILDQWTKLDFNLEAQPEILELN